MKRIPPSLLAHVPEERRPLFERYAELLITKAIPLGLIAQRDGGALWDRHVVDSLRGLLCLPSGPSAIADIGSGAGLPGIPVALARPDCRVTLIEPRARRAAFLELVVQELGLANADVRAIRAEQLQGHPFDVCLARAVAGPGESWALAERLLSPSGFLVYWAGRSWGGTPAGVASQAIQWEVCGPASAETSGPVVKMARGAPSDG